MARKRITINADSVLQGWGKSNRYFYTTLTSSYEMPNGQYAENSNAISLFRPNRRGHIGPGEAFTALTDTGSRVTGLPLNGVIRSDSEMFVILDNARIVQFGVDDVIDAHNATVAVTGEDILVYKNSTDEYILYSWNDATNGDVGRMDKTTGTYDDDWLSTVVTTQTNGANLTKDVPHKLLIGKDGLVYITNGNYIAQWDDAADEIDYQAFQVTPGFTVRSIENYGDRLAILCDKDSVFSDFSLGESKLLFWDFSSTQPDFVYDLEDSSVNASIVHNGLLYAWTIGRDASQKVKVFNGSTFENVVETTHLGEPPRYGSVGMFEDKVHFAPQGTNGTGKLACLDGTAIHDRARPTDAGKASDVGMVKNLASRFLYCGATISGSDKILKLDINKYWNGTGGLDSYWRSRLFAIEPNSTITKFHIYLSQWGTGAKFYLHFVKGYNNSQAQTSNNNDLINTEFDYADYGDVERITFTKTINNVDSFYLGLLFTHTNLTDTAAIIRQIDVEYETHNA